MPHDASPRPASPPSTSPRSRFSVACNFDPQLVDRLAEYPVYEVYGKLTTDPFGGGRPSFYLPSVDRTGLARYVQRCHARGIEFNYLLNASSMDNIEFTAKGQRELRHLLDWLAEIDVDSITVSNLFFLRIIKKSYPQFKVRISAHRETDNPRKARFWEDNGADCVVISETTIHREFETLQAIRDAVAVDLSLIVNNWCRQDCAIASNHAVLLSNASRSGRQNFPLDYCSVYCNAYRLEEPVNYVRANWIRPEDISRYQAMGFSNFKIVERNTPTDLLVMRVRAYNEQRYDGNLLDLVQNYAYPRSTLKARDRQYFSLRRMAKHFLRPSEVNLLRFADVVRYGKSLSMLYPREHDNPVYVDNRALDGFLDRFSTQGCASVDCEACGYCHRWAEKAVFIDPHWREHMQDRNERLLDALHGGSLWESYAKTVADWMSRAWQQRHPTHEPASPRRHARTLRGRRLPVLDANCRPIPRECVSVGNDGPIPEHAGRSPSKGPTATPAADRTP